MSVHRLWMPGGAYDALGRRVVGAFVAVALGAVLVLAVFSMAGADGSLSRLSQNERGRVAERVAAVAATAYASGGGWKNADLARVAEEGYAAGVRVTVFDDTGQRISGPAPDSSHLRGTASTTAPVVAEGREVGRVRVWFSRIVDSVTGEAPHLILRWTLIGGAFAMLVALVAGTLVARALTRPLRNLAGAASRFSAGEHDVRYGHHDAPGALGALAAAIDNAGDTVVAEDIARRRFVSDVRHELATPVAAMQAGLEELSDGLVDPTPSRLKALHDQAVRLGRTVDDLADMDDVGIPGLFVKRRLVDLRAVARDVLEGKQSVLRAAGVRVEPQLNSARVLGDRDRLATVLANLVDNVVRHAGDGATLTVLTAHRRDHAVIVVRDTGRGIAAEDVPHVFERRYRGRDSANVPGSGIGLALVRQLVEAHGGDISLMSAPGAGTTVTVTLPAVEATRREVSQESGVTTDG